MNQILKEKVITIVTHVRRRGNHPPESGWSGMMWVERIRNFCPSSVKRGK